MFYLHLTGFLNGFPPFFSDAIFSSLAIFVLSIQKYRSACSLLSIPIPSFLTFCINVKTAEFHLSFCPSFYWDDSGAFGGLKVRRLYTVMAQAHSLKVILLQGDI